MKKALYLTLILFICYSAYAQPITNGLIGYWPLDGAANDLGPATWNGVTYGTSWTTDRYDTVDNAIQFAYTGHKILIPDVLRTTKTMALSVWCYPTLLDNNYRWLINQRDNSTGDQFQIVVNNQTTNLSVFESAQTASLLIGSALQPNTWNHIVLQTDGTTGGVLEAWINNVYQGSLTLTAEMTYNIAETITVGVQGWTTSSGQFRGKVDEIMLFDRKLSPNEVTFLYEYDENEVTSGYWQLNTSNIYYLGRVAINGSDIPPGFDLGVQGKIVTKEVKVTLDGWSDFVFDSDYRLTPLEEVATFISANKHLPEIPSEAEVTENGFNLGEMDAKLLQKIEELTLYLIEQNERLKKANENIEALKKEVEGLKKG